MTEPSSDPMPWDPTVPPLDPAIAGHRELTEWLQTLATGLAALLSESGDAQLGLTERLDALAARRAVAITGRAAIPAIALGATRQIQITWDAPAAPSGCVVLKELTGSVLGAITAAVDPVSVSATGCTVNVSATVAIATGSGQVHVVGWVWT